MAEIALPNGPLRFPEEEIRHYPWDLWSNGERHVLTVPDDIPSVKGFQSVASNWGIKHDVTFVTRRLGTDKLVVQALRGLPRRQGAQ